MIDQDIRPDRWASNRWLGVEPAFDFVGYGLNTHGLFLVGVYAGWLCVKGCASFVGQIMQVNIGEAAFGEVDGVFVELVNSVPTTLASSRLCCASPPLSRHKMSKKPKPLLSSGNGFDGLHQHSPAPSNKTSRDVCTRMHCKCHQAPGRVRLLRRG